jgi:hypothetical protein
MKTIISNLVKVTCANQSSPIYLTGNSGKIIYRDKIDSLIGIKHPGIILGKDNWGHIWVIHNHFQFGCPQIVPIKDFSAGIRVFLDDRPVFYNPIQIVERAITHWLEKKEYSWLVNNCQQFVNKVTRNGKYSETIDEVSDGAMITGGLVSLFGLLTGSKSAINIGMTIAGVGAATKTLSRVS